MEEDSQKLHCDSGRKFPDVAAELSACTSDRAGVLVFGAIIDLSLENLLRVFFEYKSDVTKQECDFLLIQRPIPPLGSASIRAKVAHAAGALRRELMEAILQLLRVRNDFAHKPEVSELTANHFDGFYGKLPEDIKPMADKLADHFTPKNSIRARFLGCCAALDAALFLEESWLEAMSEEGDECEYRAATPNPSPKSHRQPTRRQ